MSEHNKSFSSSFFLITVENKNVSFALFEAITGCFWADFFSFFSWILYSRIEKCIFCSLWSYHWLLFQLIWIRAQSVEILSPLLGLCPPSPDWSPENTKEELFVIVFSEWYFPHFTKNINLLNVQNYKRCQQRSLWKVGCCWSPREEIDY